MEGKEKSAKTASGPHGMRDRWALRIKDRAAFGEFCVTLREEEVPFALPGFQTVALAVPAWKLQSRSKQLYEELKRNDVLEQYAITSEGKRHLPGPEEAKDLLRKFTEELRSRKYAAALPAARSFRSLTTTRHSTAGGTTPKPEASSAIQTYCSSQAHLFRRPSHCSTRIWKY